LPLEDGDLIAQLLDGLLQLLDALLLGVDDGQQRFQQRRPFGVRDGRKLELHPVRIAKRPPSSCASPPGF
jgi:hypothetical protein